MFEKQVLTKLENYQIEFSNWAEVFLFDHKEKYSKNKKRQIICVVDDDEAVLVMYKEKLQREGYEVLIAQNSKEGFEQIKNNEIDLIMVDLVMPAKDGFSLIKRIKKNQHFQDIPIIALANHDEHEDRETICEMGVIYYLVKPEYTPSEMANVVKSILEIKRKYPKVLNCLR